jgi:hypothetical protein
VAPAAPMAANAGSVYDGSDWAMAGDVAAAA